MDESNEDALMEKLEEFVYDEDKIVTYTWLSTSLNVKVNEAEDLLEKYVRKVRRTKPNDLSIIYLMLGTKNGKSLSVTLTKESELEESRAAFDCVSSQHIYSVQKSKDVDASVLFLVEALSAHNLRDKPLLGSIVGNNCVKRALKFKASVREKKVQSTSATNNVNKKEGTSETISKSNQKQNGIVGFFTKAQSKEDVKDQKTVNKPVKSKPNGIMGNFLAKVPVKKNPEPNASNKSKDANIVTDNAVEDVKDDVKAIESETKNKDESEVKKRESKRPKRTRKGNKSEQVQKKRKRIIEKHDSDSDDIFGDEDDDNPEFEENESRKRRLSSPDLVGNTTDEEPSPVFEQLSKPVNKKRKQVMRTFTDEDGYMITKNEWVLEDESEDEEKENSRNGVQKDFEVVVGNSPALINSPKTEAHAKDEGKKQSKLSESKKDGEKELLSKAAKKKPGKTDKKDKNQQTLFNFFKKT